MDEFRLIVEWERLKRQSDNDFTIEFDYQNGNFILRHKPVKGYSEDNTLVTSKSFDAIKYFIAGWKQSRDLQVLEKNEAAVNTETAKTNTTCKTSLWCPQRVKTEAAVETKTDTEPKFYLVLDLDMNPFFQHKITGLDLKHAAVGTFRLIDITDPAKPLEYIPDDKDWVEIELVE